MDAGACAVLLRELEALAERLTAADVRVVGALRPGMLAVAVRVAFDPWSRPGLARLAAADPDRDGIDEAAAWPMGADASWGIYRTDGAFHATYWIASWPAIDVGAAFLSPLLLHAQMVRAIAVTIEPISPAEGDPRGRGRPHLRRGRSGAARAHGLHGDGAAQAPDGGGRPPRGGAR